MLVGDEVVYTQKFLFFMERLKERERERAGKDFVCWISNSTKRNDLKLLLLLLVVL